MGSLSGKTAIVSGGSDGIGRAIAEKLAGEGAHVVICARNQEKLDAVVSAIGGKCRIRHKSLCGHDQQSRQRARARYPC